MLRVPQARLLAVLVPDDRSAPYIDWPVYTRAQLAARAGYTAISGTITRALNGIRPGSSSGDAHPGLLALGFVEEMTLDIDGVQEVNYRATKTGAQAFCRHLTECGSLPELRPIDVCTNHRYRNEL